MTSTGTGTGRYDVVVVGGRVAGASTALLLARAGLRVAVVDRGARGSDTVSTHALMRGGVLQLSRWGVLDAVVAAGTPAVRRTVFHYPDEEVAVTIRRSPGVDALYAPRRHLLDRLLVEAAERAGADVLHQATVTTLVRGRRGRVGGVTVRARDGRTRDVHADLTVGADGLRSTVAARVAAPVLRRGASAGAVLYRYVDGVAAPYGSAYEWAYGGGAAAGLIPTNDGATAVFVSTTIDRMRALRRHGTQEAFRRLLAVAAPALVERVEAARPVTRLRGWTGAPGHVRRSWGAGWALVGDAGYYKDPITAHGMTDGLRDAELLADAVVAAGSGSRAEAAALAGYQATRDSLSHDLWQVTEEVSGYAWRDEELPGLVRRVSAAMSDEVDHLYRREVPVAPVLSGLTPGRASTSL